MKRWVLPGRGDAPFDTVDDDFDPGASGIEHLRADDSEALERWEDRLSTYVDLQGTLDALRLRPATEPPWPACDNPMLGYLVERAAEIESESGLGSALAWLASNAWFEGALTERARFARLLDAD
jgi:hypothetical protein